MAEQGTSITSRNVQTLPFPLLQDEPDIIRLEVIFYIRFSPSLRNVEDLLDERGIEVSHETVRY